jgi:acetyl-CoA C-acetyltransferase
MDSSAIGDGAAAVYILPADQLHPSRGRPVITVAGSGSATDTLAVHDRRDPLWLSAAEASSRQAYRQAGIGPEEIDLFELHDAFTILSALSLEASGFADRGQGVALGQAGEILPTGKIPITTRGGLKARGHPVGATGIYQIVEVVEQLRGTAGGNQVAGATVGMAQNIGGSGATILTHILHRER